MRGMKEGIVGEVRKMREGKVRGNERRGRGSKLNLMKRKKGKLGEMKLKTLR